MPRGISPTEKAPTGPNSPSYLYELKRKVEVAGDVVPSKRIRVADAAGREEPFQHRSPIRRQDEVLMHTPVTRDVSSTPIMEDLGVSNPLASEQSSYLVDHSGRQRTV